MKIQTVILVTVMLIIIALILPNSDARRAGGGGRGGGGRGRSGSSGKSGSGGSSSSSTSKGGGARGSSARRTARSSSAKSSSSASKAVSNYQAHSKSKTSLTYSYGTGYSYYRQPATSYHFWGVRPIYIGRYRSSSHEMNRDTSYVTNGTASPGKQQNPQNPGPLACHQCVHDPWSYNNTSCLNSTYIGTVQGCPSVEHFCIVARFRFKNDSADEGIYRGCISGNFFSDDYLKNGDNIKIPVSNANVSSFTLCGHNFCNTGDGRLRCYECQGNGEDDTCMEEPNINSSKIAICKANEFCFIQRTMMTLNATINTTNSTVYENETIAFEVNITRGCQPYPTDDDDFQVNHGEDMIAGIASLVCASERCNSIDADVLTMPPDQMVSDGDEYGENGSSRLAYMNFCWWINSFCLIALVPRL